MKTTRNSEEKQLCLRIKIWLTIFIVFLLLSGITAFPIETQLSFAMRFIHLFPQKFADWISNIYMAVRETNRQFPYLAYGTDWLAFAHIVIATAFIGPLQNPVKNIWVIQFGMISCVMILPLALIAGPIRHIPFFWQMIDCSFGVFGIIPLYICYRLIRRLEEIQNFLQTTSTLHHTEHIL